MTGPEELVNRLTGTDDARPLRRRGEGMAKVGKDGLRCPLCGGGGLGIDVTPRRDGTNEVITLAHCRSCRAGLDQIAAAVGMTPSEVRAREELVLDKYPIRPPELPPTPGAVRRWHRALLRNPELLGYLTRQRGISMEVIRRFVLGHDGDGDCYTLPVFNWDGNVHNGSLPIVNLRRYKPGGDPKMLSLYGSGAQLYTHVRTFEPVVVIAEGETDALRAISLGINAVTQTGGALSWKDEWSERIGNRHVCIVYDRDRGGELGEARVRESFERVGRHLSLTIVRLPLPYREKGGADLSDYLADHTKADLMALLRSSHKAQHARSPGRSRDLRRARPVATAKRRSGEGS